MQKALEHIKQAEREQVFFNTINDECRSAVRSAYRQNEAFHPPPPHSRATPITGPRKAHYSFDYAQQVHYPSNPMQPGPIYFLTPRSVPCLGYVARQFPDR